MISTVYNYYLSTYGGRQATKYDTHKKDELKNIYNTMVKVNTKAPLYMFENVVEAQKYAIDLKETARNIKNIATSLSADDGTIAGFSKKKADSSNQRVAVATYIGEDIAQTEGTLDEANVPELDIHVDKLATPQVNVGNFLKSDRMDLDKGTYSFDMSVGEYTYEFQFNIASNDTNKSIQEKLVRLINRSNVGVKAELVEDEYESNAIRITSEETGIQNYRKDIFTISHDKSNETRDVVEYFGLNKVINEASNAHFTINGLERSTAANTFTVEGKYEITLKGESQTDSDNAKIGLKPDLDTILENVDELLTAYNSMVDLAIEKYDGSYESGRLLRDVSSMARINKHTLDSAGFVVQDDGHINIEESLLVQSANEGTLGDSLHKLNRFKQMMILKAEHININPMSYVDKKVVAYPHPTRNFPNPYVNNRYSGMMFSAVV